jgi:hypothetical protein
MNPRRILGYASASSESFHFSLPGLWRSAMAQLRTVSMVFAIIASVVALVAGVILFFVIEPPFLASIFLASASIAIGCFVLTGIAAYLST